MAARVVAQPVQQHKRGEINEGDLLVSMCLTPIAVPMRSHNVYPDFGFYGLPHENSNTHISRFIRNCQNFHASEVNEDAIKLRLFPFTLRDATLEWLDAKPYASITIWEELTRKFCNKVFPPARVVKIRLKIQIFQQKDGESHHEAWNRFNELMRKCPHHGITLGTKCSTSTPGLHHCQNLKLMTPKSSTPKAAGMYELDGTTSINAQIATLTKRVELFVKLQTHGANAMMANSVCENCGRNHATESCMMLTSSEERVNFIQNSSRNFNSYENNFQQERKPSLGDMFQQYVQKMDKLTPVKVKVYVPPLPFPQRLRKKSIEQNIHVINIKSEVQSSEITIERPQKKKDDQEVIDETTRVEKYAPNTTENGESTETSAAKAPSLEKAYMPPILSPQKVKKNKQDTNYEKFLDVLKKLQINVPFIDALLQIPSYEKFLKEMLTKKRKLPEFETVALPEKSSARLEQLASQVEGSREEFGLCEVNSTSITLQLTDRTISRPHDIPEDRDIPVILGRPFLATGPTFINSEKGELILRIEDKNHHPYPFYPLEHDVAEDSTQYGHGENATNLKFGGGRMWKKSRSHTSPRHYNIIGNTNVSGKMHIRKSDAKRGTKTDEEIKNKEIGTKRQRLGAAIIASRRYHQHLGATLTLMRRLGAGS
ncbi:uncharacterized protein LOC111408160 [Olea europaea var. sylvestris]|uniref:uncharacterized protein LOC111408160 n=1 Tax=Olea europaea var. sylvestris TaxID=158386 RepID=UPI000C1D8529|nr:uncharacterized protein LOC111408160 [Olea europaea var. sylvestris]